MGLVALPGGAGDLVLSSAHAAEDFEQEIVDQYALAMSAAGLSDGHIRQTRAVVIGFARSLTKPVWEATCADANRQPAARLGQHAVQTIRPQALREDRILHEIHATGGGIRRICDLFGLSVEGATRYLKTVEHSDVAIEGERVP